MELNRREAIATGVGLALTPFLPKQDTIEYIGGTFTYERDLVLRPDEKWKVYARRVKGRPQLLDGNTFSPVWPLEDVNIKYLVGIDEKGEFKPMPCLIERGQTIKVICYEYDYTGRMEIGEILPPIKYTMVT